MELTVTSHSQCWDGRTGWLQQSSSIPIRPGLISMSVVTAVAGSQDWRHPSLRSGLATLPPWIPDHGMAPAPAGTLLHHHPALFLVLSSISPLSLSRHLGSAFLALRGKLPTNQLSRILLQLFYLTHYNIHQCTCSCPWLHNPVALVSRP